MWCWPLVYAHRKAQSILELIGGVQLQVQSKVSHENYQCWHPTPPNSPVTTPAVLICEGSWVLMYASSFGHGPWERQSPADIFLGPNSGWPIIKVGMNERGNQCTQCIAILYTWEWAMRPASEAHGRGSLGKPAALSCLAPHREELREVWGHQQKASLTARPFHMLRPVESAHFVFTLRHSACNWDELPCGQWQHRLTEPFIKMAVC